MTLSNQNKILLIFSIISTIFCALFFVGIINFFIQTTPEGFITGIFNKDFSIVDFFTKQSSFYVILSLLVFSVYVPFVGFIIYKAFEKTNSAEVVFFVAMLLGFFAETFRLAIPIFNLSDTYTSFLRAICKIAFFGQMQVILALLLQASFANEKSTREVDKLLGIISAVSLCLSILIPVNFSNIEEFYMPIFSFQIILEIIRSTFLVIGLVAMLFSPISKKYIDAKIASIGFFITSVGYIVLIKTMTLISFLIGLILLIVGTSMFLKRLYKYYMWK